MALWAFTHMPGALMFHPLAYDERSRTYLARFSGALTEQDQVDFATAARECLLLHGPTAGLQDYREVTSCAITANQTVSRGRSRPIMTGQKRVVVADGLVFGMMRMFGKRPVWAALRHSPIVPRIAGVSHEQ
jgi:hypothetical protein